MYQIENLKFGGNTSCLEVRNGANECVIFDAGSGIRALGQTLMQEAAGAPNWLFARPWPVRRRNSA